MINISNKPGFSLMEIVAVLFIITVAFVGVMSLVEQNIQVEDFNKKKLIAHELAQEGIELIRRQRDSNWLEGNSYNNGLAEGRYIADYKNPLPVSVADFTDDQTILQKQDNGFYVHDTNYPDTNFKRMMNITKLTDHSFLVSARVRWNERGNSRTYIADTVLYDWY